MQKADEALAKVHLLKQVNFPPLFNQFEFVAANPVTSIENTFADYWSVTFQVFLQTGIKTQKKIPLQGSFLELMLGTNGRIIGLEYNHLPSLKTKISNLYKLLPETQEVENTENQTRSPNAVQETLAQKLPQIVYNLNPDTGIIAPYFLSTAGELPAVKEANTIKAYKPDKQLDWGKDGFYRAENDKIIIFTISIQIWGHKSVTPPVADKLFSLASNQIFSEIYYLPNEERPVRFHLHKVEQSNFKVEFVDYIEKENSSIEDGILLGYTESIGNTTVNFLKVVIPQDIEIGKKGSINFLRDVQIAQILSSTFIFTFFHELCHASGLRHTGYEGQLDKLPEIAIKKGISKEKLRNIGGLEIQTIIDKASNNNLMIQYGNGFELLTEQMEIIDKQVKDDEKND